MDTIIDKLIEMRLVIEGAVTLYNQKPDSVSDEYSLIGEALYLLRDKVNEGLNILQDSGKNSD